MKKVLTLLFAAGLISTGTLCNSVFAEQIPPAVIQHQRPSKEQMKQKFEQRLNLTDKQKEKAKAIHQEGREQIKPVIEQIRSKHQEIEAVKLSKMSDKAQQEKIAELTAEIRELEKKAHEIRKFNSQEFEKILTKKQKNELAKMKAEGRAQFAKNHPARPPFGPRGIFGPMLPPPHQPDFTSK